MFDWFTDPRVFNYVIMSLYGMNILRWGIHGAYGDAAYWFFALGITFTVTFIPLAGKS